MSTAAGHLMTAYASAYPDPAISAPAMTAIALVVVACLAGWLVLVLRAARVPGAPAGQPARQPEAVARPAGLAEAGTPAGPVPQPGTSVPRPSAEDEGTGQPVPRQRIAVGP